MKPFFNLNINYTKRIYGLDILRSVAILIVMLGHCGPLLNESDFQDFPYISLLDGVELFFVLSGYLIGGILIKEIDNGDFKLKQLLNFWKRRWFRTLPNYYLILIINILLVSYNIIPGKPENISADFFLFLQNFRKPFTDFFWESWSLCVEEWFYIFFGLGILISMKLFKPITAYVVCTILLILLPLFYRISISYQDVNEFWWDVIFRKTVLCRLDAIGYGALAAYLHLRFPYYWIKYKIFLLLISMPLLIYWPYLDINKNGWFAKTLSFSVIPLFCSLLLPFFSDIKQGKGRVFMFFTITSVLSYSLYLINLSLVEQIIEVHLKINGILSYGLFWLTCYLVAFLLYTLYEKPLMDLRDKT